MNTDDLRIALKVAEHGSITSAATSLDMLTATASAAVKRIERDLGVELFIRTTRRLRLSAAGERLLPELAAAMQQFESARRSVQEDQGIIEGDLRLAVSSDLGRNLVVPWLDEFISDYPSLRLEVNVSDSNIDFYRDAVDIALRYGSPNESNLYGFKICDVPGVLGAAPSYLNERGVPAHPHELASHDGLFYKLFDITHDTWVFEQGDQVYKVKMSGKRAANDGDLVRRWCVAGHGVAVKSALDMADDLLAGRVVPLLSDYKAKASELWIVSPSRQFITPAVRRLRSLLQDKTAAVLMVLKERALI